MDNLAGRPVYGGGSFAPNRGQVDPRGYMLRELRKRGIQKTNRGRHLGWYKNGKAQGSFQPGKPTMQSGPYGGVSQIGRDGQSDTRSGLAAQMLQQQLEQAKVTQTSVKPDGSKTSIQFGGAPTGRVTAGSGSAEPSVGGIKGLTQGGVAPHQQVVNINANGQLDLPYNQQYAEGVLQMKDELNQQLMDLQAEQQSEELDYAQNSRNAGIDYQDLLRQTLNKNAGAGTAFSSAYGSQMGTNAREHNNYMNDLLGQHNLFGQQVAAQRTAAAASLQDYIRRAAQQYADSLSGGAGSLGYGTNKQPSIKKPTSPNKKKRKRRRSTALGGPR